jgi:hypothetical protein
MLRPFALTLLVLLSACASRQRPVEVVGTVPAAVESLDPDIHPLSREEEELAR